MLQEAGINPGVVVRIIMFKTSLAQSANGRELPRGLRGSLKMVFQSTEVKSGGGILDRWSAQTWACRCGLG